MSERANPTLAEIVEAMEESLRSLQSVLSSLSDEEWHAPTGCPGWDVHDVASHVVGVEQGIAGVPAPDHVLPDGLTHVRDDRGREMELAVDYRRNVAPADLLREFGEAIDRGLANRQKSTRDPEELTDGPFGWKMPYWQLLRIRTFDVFAHEQDVRRAVSRPGNLDGRAATLIGEMFAEMVPGIAASRVEDLGNQGTTIVVTEPGPPEPRTVALGNGETVATTITLPFSELLALVCGRADVRQSLVQVAGDADLAERVMKALAVTP
jgi:uncharacterized protein (TIGR03083 family)